MAKTLHWGIKSSLIEYVRRAEDGTVEVAGGAFESAFGRFAFPEESGSASTSGRFCGSVRVQAHGGALDLTFESPWIEEREGGWVVSMADPDDTSRRFDLVSIPIATRSHDGTFLAAGTALTYAGAEYFVGPYSVGTAFDDPEVLEGAAHPLG